MKARTVTGTLTAYLSECSAQYIGPKELAELEGSLLMRALSFSSQEIESLGWTKVGTAEVILTLQSPTEILSNTVAALRAAQTSTLADAQKRSTEIESKIQSLLAISFDEVAE